jgi:hypothetical protein
MKATCDITFEYKDEKTTNNILKSIKVDNLDFINSKKSGNKLITHIETKSISSLLHTLDDYLACVSIAEKIVDKD